MAHMSISAWHVRTSVMQAWLDTDLRRDLWFRVFRCTDRGGLHLVPSGPVCGSPLLYPVGRSISREGRARWRFRM